MSNIPKYRDHEQFDLSLTNHELVNSALQKIKANKARGHDHIPPRALRASLPSITQSLSHLLNKIICSNVVPNSWKRGEIVPHFKKDSQLDKVSFRPVTVLLPLSKILEHTLHRQMADHFKNIFHKYMFGYRKHHGCPKALLSFTEQWKEDLNKHNIIDTIAIDLSKAFDCLSHDLNLEKLKFYGLSDHALSLMRSYLSSRYQRVKKLSDAFPAWQGVSKGVAQGSILGPTLFNIFLNDLAYAMKQYRIVNYADDTNIHCSKNDVRAFQNNLIIDLENATSRFIQNGMKPNPDKYQAMVLGKPEVCGLSLITS